MTEAEWIASADPALMLQFIEQQASDRKLRLFAVACCRRVWRLIRSPESRRAVEVAERYADGLATRIQLQQAEHHAGYNLSRRIGRPRHARAWAAEAAWRCASQLPRGAAAEVVQAADNPSWEAECQSHLLREIFGNPFAAVQVEPRWRQGNPQAIAEAIHQQATFDNLPILGDALEDAGCIDVAILNHCRQPAEHVKGCWVVDLVLAKS